MRTLIFVICMLFSASAWALPIPTEYIGRAYDDGGAYPATSNYVGPANRGGTFIGFRIADRYRVSIVSGILRGYGEWDEGPMRSGNIAMALFKGSQNFNDTSKIIPTSNIIWSSESFVFQLDGQQQIVSHEADINLDPGDYWMRYRGRAFSGTLTAEGFGLDGEKLAAIHNPEPATLLLMGGGLLAMFRRRKS